MKPGLFNLEHWKLCAKSKELYGFLHRWVSLGVATELSIDKRWTTCLWKAQPALPQSQLTAPRSPG